MSLTKDDLFQIKEIVKSIRKKLTKTISYDDYDELVKRITRVEQQLKLR